LCNLLPLLSLDKYRKENKEFFDEIKDKLPYNEGIYSAVEIVKNIKEDNFKNIFRVEEQQLNDAIVIHGLNMCDHKFYENNK
jgi:hypothetical protein